MTEPGCRLGRRLTPRADETQVGAGQRGLAKGEVGREVRLRDGYRQGSASETVTNSFCDQV